MDDVEGQKWRMTEHPEQYKSFGSRGHTDDEKERVKGRIFEVTARILLSLHAVLITTVLAFIIIVHFTTAIKGVNRKKVLPILILTLLILLILTLLATMFFRPNLWERRSTLLYIIFGIALVTSGLAVYGDSESEKSSSPFSGSVFVDVMVVAAVASSGIMVPLTVYNIVNPVDKQLWINN
jgi:hypothetical protein